MLKQVVVAFLGLFFLSSCSSLNVAQGNKEIFYSKAAELERPPGAFEKVVATKHSSEPVSGTWLSMIGLAGGEELSKGDKKELNDFAPVKVEVVSKKPASFPPPEAAPSLSVENSQPDLTATAEQEALFFGISTISKEPEVIDVQIAGQSSSTGPLLSAVVQRAVKSHPSVRATQAKKLSSEYEVDSQVAGYFPSIDLESGVGVEDTDGVDKEGQTLLRSETKISLRQLVFDGWETSSRVAAAKAGLKAATAILNAQEQEISLQAAASYIDVFRSNKFVELAKKNLKNHQQLGQKIKRRAQTGYGNKANLSQVNARVALANARLIRFQGELDTATAQFQESVNELPPEGMVLPVIPASLVSEDVDSLIAIAVMDNPALKASSYRISEKVALTDQVESEFMPKIYVNASRSWNEDVDGVRGKNHDALGMVNLKYNLFNGAGSLARLDKANYELDHAAEQMKAYKRQVIKEVRSAYIQLQVAHLRLPALKTHVQMANKVLKASYKQFKLGQRSILDLLDQRNELFQAEIALLTEQTRKIYAAYRLLASQGGLLNYLQQRHAEVII